MLNSNRNRPAPLIQDILNLTFNDIEWAICYPDGSYAIGIPSMVDPSELYGRAKAKARSQVLGNMGYDIIEHGWMKPRGVDECGPVVVFKLSEAVCRA